MSQDPKYTGASHPTHPHKGAAAIPDIRHANQIARRQRKHMAWLAQDPLLNAVLTSIEIDQRAENRPFGI